MTGARPSVKETLGIPSVVQNASGRPRPVSPLLIGGFLSPVAAAALPNLNLPSLAEGSEASPQICACVRALISHEDEASVRFIADLLADGMTTASIFEDVLTEAARELGAAWERDDCTFYEVTIGTGRIQRLIRELSQRFQTEQAFPGSTGRILLAGASDEQHSLGVTVIAEYLIRDGWDVEIGPGFGSERFLDKVREVDYSLVGFSVAVSGRIQKLQQEIRRVRQVSRNRDVRILVGGALLLGDPGLFKRLGADGMATDASSTLVEARRLLNA